MRTVTVRCLVFLLLRHCLPFIGVLDAAGCSCLRALHRFTRLRLSSTLPALCRCITFTLLHLCCIAVVVVCSVVAR
jgi:hypothetical protein